MGDARSYDGWAQRIAIGDWFGSEVFYQAAALSLFPRSALLDRRPRSAGSQARAGGRRRDLVRAAGAGVGPAPGNPVARSPLMITNGFGADPRRPLFDRVESANPAPRPQSGPASVRRHLALPPRGSSRRCALIRRPGSRSQSGLPPDTLNALLTGVGTLRAS